MEFKTREELQQMPQTEEEHLENQYLDYEDKEKSIADAEVKAFHRLSFSPFPQKRKKHEVNFRVHVNLKFIRFSLHLLQLPFSEHFGPKTFLQKYCWKKDNSAGIRQKTKLFYIS